MSKIHILERNADGSFRCAIHTAMPGGSNSGSKTWASVLLATGRAGTTALTIGTAPGNITQVEADAITAGTTVEVATNLWVSGTGAEAATALKAAANAYVAQLWTNWQGELAWYGQEVN